MHDIREDATQYDPHLIEQKTQSPKDYMTIWLARVKQLVSSKAKTWPKSAQHIQTAPGQLSLSLFLLERKNEMEVLVKVFTSKAFFCRKFYGLEV